MVEEVLKEFPETRNCDISLSIQVWRKFYGFRGLVIRADDLYIWPSQASIQRWRATIQNEDKKYLPTVWAVAKRRKMNEREWKEALGYKVEVTGQHSMTFL